MRKKNLFKTRFDIFNDSRYMQFHWRRFCPFEQVMCVSARWMRNRTQPLYFFDVEYLHGIDNGSSMVSFSNILRVLRCFLGETASVTGCSLQLGGEYKNIRDEMGAKLRQFRDIRCFFFWNNNPPALGMPIVAPTTNDTQFEIFF